MPDRIPIRYQPEYRSWCIGHYDDGQFLGFVVVGNAYDYLASGGPEHSRDFLDPQSRRSALAAGAARPQRCPPSTPLFGPAPVRPRGPLPIHRPVVCGYRGGEPVQRAFARLQEQVDALPGRRYGDIAIGLFEADLEVDDLWFELADESNEERGDWAELYPNRWGFHPPWDGGYDT